MAQFWRVGTLVELGDGSKGRVMARDINTRTGSVRYLVRVNGRDYWAGVDEEVQIVRLWHNG